MEILTLSIVLIIGVIGYVMLSVLYEWLTDWFFRIIGNVPDGVKGARIRRKERRERKERYEGTKRKE